MWAEVNYYSGGGGGGSGQTLENGVSSADPWHKGVTYTYLTGINYVSVFTLAAKLGMMMTNRHTDY